MLRRRWEVISRPVCSSPYYSPVLFCDLAFVTSSRLQLQFLHFGGEKKSYHGCRASQYGVTPNHVVTDPVPFSVVRQSEVPFKTVVSVHTNSEMADGRSWLKFEQNINLSPFACLVNIDLQSDRNAYLQQQNDREDHQASSRRN
jgi:hypothetical protein